MGGGEALAVDDAVRLAELHDADADPYIKMVGGEFDGHGKQQTAKIRAITAGGAGFAPLKDAAKDFELHEEWYTFRNIAPDMQVILAQETTGMA